MFSCHYVGVPPGQYFFFVDVGQTCGKPVGLGNIATVEGTIGEELEETMEQPEVVRQLLQLCSWQNSELLDS